MRDYCREQKYKNQCDLKWSETIAGRTNAANAAPETMHFAEEIPFSTADTSVILGLGEIR